MYHCEVVSKPEHVLRLVARCISYISIVNLGWQYIKYHILNVWNKIIKLKRDSNKWPMRFFYVFFQGFCLDCVRKFNVFNCLWIAEMFFFWPFTSSSFTGKLEKNRDKNIQWIALSYVREFKFLISHLQWLWNPVKSALRHGPVFYESLHNKCCYKRLQSALDCYKWE